MYYTYTLLSTFSSDYLQLFNKPFFIIFDFPNVNIVEIGCIEKHLYIWMYSPLWFDR